MVTFQHVRSIGIVCSSMLAAVAVSVPSEARAESNELKYDLRVDVPVTLAATSWLIGSELAMGKLAASPCRWCDRHADGSDSLNGIDASFRSALRWNNPSAADALSTVVGYGISPIASFGMLALAQSHDNDLRQFPIDALLIAEAVALSASVNQVVKFSAGRERPFVHARTVNQRAQMAQPDDNTSFYSGHTSVAFSLAVSAGTVATLHGYCWAPWVWVTGLSLATATGYLRVAGDKHYLTDVLAAAATGSAIGFVVPFVFHRPSSHAVPDVAVANIPGGALVTLAWN